jgi:hypothetical protein
MNAKQRQAQANQEAWELSVTQRVEEAAQNWSPELCQFWINRAVSVSQGSYMDGFETRAKCAAAYRRLAQLNRTGV